MDRRPTVNVTSQSLGQRVFVIYDRATGRILHRHEVHPAIGDTAPAEAASTSPAHAQSPGKDTKGAPGMDLTSLLDLIGEGTLRMDLVRGGRKTLEVIEVPPQAEVWSSVVDPKTQQLVARPSLKLTPEKHELNGDGKDSATIAIEVVNSAGVTARNMSTQVKVSTTRGRLSTPGGLVTLKGGKGVITLTAPAETVDRVTVMATCRDVPCSPAQVDLAFL